MMEFIGGQFMLLAAIYAVLWIPGRTWVIFLERNGQVFDSVLRWVITVTLSIVTVDFLMIILGRLGIPLEGWSVLGGIFLITVGMIFLAKKMKNDGTRPISKISSSRISSLFFPVFFAAVLLKSIYGIPLIVPSSTDLGHHMYWVKKIVMEKKLPVYEEREIEIDSGGKYIVGEKKPISDFIVGEHLVLGAVVMISGKGVTSSFSLVVLFAIHIASVLSVYALARRIFSDFSWGESAAIWALFFFGVLYALGQSQMKFVFGGAIGNSFGNLFFPVIFLLIITALLKKRSDIFIAGMFGTFALIYTHHLSALLFGVSLIGSLLFFFFFSEQSVRKNFFLLFRSLSVLCTAGILILFFLFFFTPSYISNMAVSQVVGEAQNEEHQGLSFSQFVSVAGDPRAALGLLGLFWIIARKRFRKKPFTAMLAGWTGVLIFLTLFPDIARIDLPSARVANYAAAPLALLSGLSAALLFQGVQRFGMFSSRMILSVAIFFTVTAAYRGLLDNSTFFKVKPFQREQSLELFHAGEYMSQNIPSSVVVLHDHINIPTNSFLKTFFMRDFNYPFYRAMLFRYERIADKQEKCTLYVISSPDSREAEKCEQELHIGAVLVNEKIDGQQFQHFRKYEKVYSDAFQSVYARETKSVSQKNGNSS